MNLLIHDLTDAEFKKIENQYPKEEWNIISDKGCIKPCNGCFGCWKKTPGECIIKDGYEKTGVELAKCQRAEIISKLSFGSPSSFIKNVIDRSISYLLPFLNIEGTEMHHPLRYKRKPIPFTVHFYGSSITQKEKETAVKYIKALLVNIKGNLESVDFFNAREEKNLETKNYSEKISAEEKIIFFNCSPRGEKSNTKQFFNLIQKNLTCPFENYNFVNYISRPDELIAIVKSASRIILGTPMYADGMPSHVLHLLETLHEQDKNSGRKIHFVCNIGFYESSQIENLLNIAKNFCKKTGYQYCGSLAIGGGEMLGTLSKSIPLTKGPMKNTGLAILKFADAISKNQKAEDSSTEPYMFPRLFYKMCGNLGWKKEIKANGLKVKDLYKKIDF